MAETPAGCVTEDRRSFAHVKAHARRAKDRARYEAVGGLIGALAFALAMIAQRALRHPLPER
jgi:hypothetical protein